MGENGTGRVARFVGLSVLLLVAGNPGAEASEKEPTRVEIRQAACGALLRDNFNNGSLNANLWQRWEKAPGIQIEIENGELCLRGTSRQVSEEQLHHDPEMLWHYVGITSNPLPQNDVALAVRVKSPSGISSEPGAHAVSVHLCGNQPDTFAEVLFGKLGGKATQDIIHEYARGLPDDAPYPDALGWFLAIWIDRYAVSGKPLPAQGDEGQTFHDVLVDYDGQTHLSQAFLKLREQWVQLGKPEPLVRGLTVVELKMMDASPLSGAYREARFDDCRLYPNPRHHPVRFVAIVTRSGDVVYHGPRLRLGLYTSDGKHKVSDGLADAFGTVELPVVSPYWTTFPVPAMVRIFRGQAEVGRAFIEAHDVEGLYPGDVWAFETSKIPPIQQGKTTSGK